MSSRRSDNSGANSSRQAGVRIAPVSGRLEDARLLTGRGRYIDDLPVGPATLHAAILRSPHAHAAIGDIDAEEARAMKGVHCVLTGADIAQVLDPFPNIVRSAPDYRAVALDTVRYVGEPVAVVLARDRYVAEDALETIMVDFDPLPAVTDVEAAFEDSAPQLHRELGTNVAWRRHYSYGDPKAAFESADRIVSTKLHFPKYNSTPLETYGVVAEYLPDSDGYTIHANFQGPFSLLPVMARALRTPEHRIGLVVPEDVGGSFGIKAMIYPYMALMAACSRLAGRPVKWIEDRPEHLLGSASGTDRCTLIEAAVAADGRILGIRMNIKENVGAYLRAPEPSCVMRSLTTFSGPYRIDNGEIDAACIMTNKLPTGLNRGYGGQQYMFSLERLMDRVAAETGIDRLEVRRRNFLSKEEFPHLTTTGSRYDSGDYAGCLDKALSLMQQQGWHERQAELRAQGRLAGIGIATVVHSAASNIGYVTLALTPEERGKPNYHHKSGSSDFAQISLDPSGRLRVQIATASAGQGHATSVAQIAAGQFGLRAEDVDVVNRMDTRTTPWTITSGTYASRFSVVVGGAVHRAAARLAGHVRAVAGELLECDPETLEIADGVVREQGGSNKSISLRGLAGAVQWNRGAISDPEAVQLQVSESYGAPNLTAPDAEDRVNAAATYGFMADCALVEVDRQTGICRVLEYLAVHDIGRAINETLVRGQISGGIVQGMAGALYEHCKYDEDGQMLTSSFMDYLCPTAVEAPNMTITHHDSPSPFSELGTKGCGENSAMSGPAVIASAVEDALAEFGARIDRLPVTPAETWRLISQEGAQ